ncbi:MAG: peptide chain release factor 1 [bacterium]|nr:peptide chain release factor 1 [bacterium]
MEVGDLRVYEEELRALEEELANVVAGADPRRLKEMTRRHAQLQEIMAAARRVAEWRDRLEQSEEVLREGGDEGLLAMAREEREAAMAGLARAEEALQLLLLPRDPQDSADTIVEIRAGTGGEEATLFAADLYRMYTRYAERKGWRVEPMNTSYSETRGIKEAIFSVSGEDVYRYLKYEAGVHRVQRVPETEASGRIHTSAASVAVLPEAEEVDVEIKPEDLRIDVFRSSGCGGQHVNTTDSAVRITHLPTGVVVTCQDEKSQIKNKAKALRVLRARLLERAREEAAAARAEQRRSMVRSGDRSEKIRTYNFPQNRVTDHRIGLTVYALDQVLDGELDRVIMPLIEYDTQERLRQLFQRG